MCLYIDDDGDFTLLDSGQRKARKHHWCGECRRRIAPGESYQSWHGVDNNYDGRPVTSKMCGHCWGTVLLGCEFTGCPRQFYWDFIHDMYDDCASFVLDILGHDLTRPQRFAMLRTVAGRRRHWRWSSGDLMAVPA